MDGSPSGISVKTGYVPSPDMVQEVNVLQNAVDAEYGHSSGSAISVVMKSGNERVPWDRGFVQFQRTQLECARQPGVPNSTTRLGSTMYGGTFSRPIIKNKLFNFVRLRGLGQDRTRNALQHGPD